MTDAAPDVSVIIPAYNALPYLHRSLESVVSQTLGADRIEVVIVDDGSTDGTGEAIDEWAARYPGLFRVVHAAGSGGPATPRNTGLDLARGRYVFFLDADDYLGVEALERMLRTADEHGSDVVLGRMVSDTGRKPPGVAYRTTDPDVDLFDSGVYWTLSPLKLFRRSLIEESSLRFPTHLPNGSDQPFTALAYLRAAKISVLGDYDYYVAVLRDDGSHVTLSGPVSNRLDMIEEMIALLEREVPDAERRAPLMARHFQGDLRHVVNRLRDRPADEQRSGLERIRGIVRGHLDEHVVPRLAPGTRVIYALVDRGLFDDVLAHPDLGRPLAEVELEVVVEGDRAYAALPFFRDAALGLPDRLFEMSDRVRAVESLTTFSWAEGTLRVAGTAGLRGVARAPEVQLVLRSRRSPDSEHVAPASTSEGLRFEAEVDLLTVADGAPLGAGRWDVHVQVSVDGVGRVRRLTWPMPDPDVGPEVEPLPPPALAWVARDTDEGWTARAFLGPRGGMSVDVGGPESRPGSAFADWRAEWHGADLLVSARRTARIDAPMSLAVGRDDDDVRLLPLEVEGDRLAGRVPIGELDDGRWSTRLRVGVAPRHRATDVPVVPDGRQWGTGDERTSVSAVRAETLTIEVRRGRPGLLTRGLTWARGVRARASRG